MLDFVDAYFDQFDFLGEEEREIFKQNIEISQYSPGDFIQKEGKIENRLSIILSGIVRMYYTNDNADDITLWIADEGMHIGDPLSVFNQVPSKINIEAIEHCLIATFNMEELDRIQMDYPRLLLHKTHNLKLEICEVWERMCFFATMNPEQRFEFLLKNRPALFDRVQQKHLASYIGITQVSMSRIKKRLEPK